MTAATEKRTLSSITIAQTGTWSASTPPDPSRHYGRGSLETYEHPRAGTFDGYVISPDAPVFRFDLLSEGDAFTLAIAGPMKSDEVPAGIIDACYSFKAIDPTARFYGAGSFTSINTADWIAMAREQFGFITQTFAEYQSTLS